MKEVEIGNSRVRFSDALDDLLLTHEFSKPWTLGEKSALVVVPVLRKAIPLRRDYVVLEEVEGKVNLKDSGSIRRVIVEAKTDKPVFIRGGGVLRGLGTQSRGVQFGVVARPRIVQEIPVLCVHASHRIASRSEFKRSDYAPLPVARALRSRSQSGTWHAVRSWTRKIKEEALITNHIVANRSVSTHLYCDDDNLVSALAAAKCFRSEVEEALKSIPADLKNQVGMVILDNRGILGIEVFDHPDSWQALSKSIVRQYRDILRKKVHDKKGTDKSRLLVVLTKFLNKAKECKELDAYENEESKTALLDGEITGEYTLMSNRIIHLLLTRKESRN